MSGMVGVAVLLSALVIIGKLFESDSWITLVGLCVLAGAAFLFFH